MHAAAEPVPPPHPGADAAPRFRVHAWWPALRLLATAAQVLSAGNLLYLVAISLLGILEGLDAFTPLELLLRMGVLSLLPLVLVGLLRRLTAATLLVEPTRLVLQLRDVRFEIPLESVAGIEPWKLPLPGSVWRCG
jgi:apolipoprotein N-acyltransferase